MNMIASADILVRSDSEVLVHDLALPTSHGTPSQRHRIARVLVSALLLTVAGSALARPSGAQLPAMVARVPAPSWFGEVSGGIFSQPVSDGGTGPIFSVTVGRQIADSKLRLLGKLATARITDVRAPRPDRYIVDRDWRIAALGADFVVPIASRVEIVLGASAGALWSRDRRVGSIGTPIPPGFPDEPATANWDAGAALIPEIQLAYRLGSRVAITGGAAAVQRVFTDTFFGDAGGTVALGVALSW